MVFWRFAIVMDSPAPQRRTHLRIVKAVCPHDCPDTCAMEIAVEDGKAVSVRGGDMPFTAGTLCTKVARYLDRTYAPSRILYPMKRIGRKGEGRFARISWYEALDTIAARFKAVAAENPQQILPVSYAGTMGMVNYASMDRRFFHRLGASLLERTLCSSAGKAGSKITLGGSVGSDPEQAEHSKLIIIWGSNPVISNLHFWTRCQQAKRRGAKLVIIDPRRNETAEKCHQHIALYPGTDAALALAMMHVIIVEGLTDADYIDKHTLGYTELVARVQEWTPQRAAAICGITPEEIINLAREYARTRPAMIRINFGLQRHAGGGMAVRTITCLPALTGSWRDAAGGVLLMTSDFYGFNHQALERPDLIRGKPRSINIAALGDALTAATPPVKAAYVYNNNPVAVCPDSRKVIAGFLREDLFTVVHEIFQTDTADYADILLPATTQLEHTDLHKSYGHLYVQANQPAIAPVGEAKANAEVFRLLAARMGFDDPCLSDSDEDICRQALDSKAPALNGINWESLKTSGWQRLNVPAAPFAQGGFPTPSGKCEFYSASAKTMGLDPLPGFTPPRESPANPSELSQRYPLAFISPPHRHFLNSSFANLDFSLKDAGVPTLEIHPDDAAARGITENTEARVFNDRGEYTVRARITDRVRRGVVSAPSVWWKKLSPDKRNANELTSQAVADMGGAATYYDCLVDVAPAI
jgi:anaerobic selenocysteine-containing dehydrogenase